MDNDNIGKRILRSKVTLVVGIAALVAGLAGVTIPFLNLVNGGIAGMTAAANTPAEPGPWWPFPLAAVGAIAIRVHFAANR